MTAQFCAGAVWEVLHDFKKGEGPQKKYVVLLNDCLQATDRFFCAFATSKGLKHFPVQTAKPCGAPDHAYFRIDPTEENCFPDQTWVVFSNIIVLSKQELEQRAAHAIGSFKQMLKEDRIRSVLNCATKADDVDGHVEEAIKQTVTAMNAKSAAAKQAAATAMAVQKPPNAKELKAALTGMNMYDFEELTGVTAKQVKDLTDFDTGTIETIKMGLDLMIEAKKK